MIAIKRLSVLFGVIYGGVLFREAHMRIRLFGAVLMLAGTVLILLFGE
jgi:drug/metabolite transporter (DMT)-like permease